MVGGRETTGGGVSPTYPQRIAVLGTPISVTSYAEVLELLDRPPDDRAALFCFCNVYSVMSARRDQQIAAALRSADVATPDGVPLVWALHGLGHRVPTRVYGPDLMHLAFRHGREVGWRHFLYGSSQETLAALLSRIQEFAPGARVVGSLSPPFRQLTAAEEDEHLDRIRATDADLVWVGLGFPKQELWMARVRGELPGKALLGVGAAFDFLAETKRQAPPIMQRAGLEWLFRLSQEPRRLWRRYLWNNPAYLVLLGSQLARHRLRAMRAR